MPTLTTIQQCRLCEAPLTSRSLAADVCWACFERHFRTCEDCETIILAEDNLRHRWYLRDYGFAPATGNLCFPCQSARECNEFNRRHRTWRSSPFPAAFATYRHIGSARKYGVEIETSFCEGYRDLERRTVFGCKDDCTIAGREFDSPILYGDEGLSCITEFAGYAKSKNWQVNRDCGCHTHYDMRDETNSQLASVVYAYRVFYPLWRTFIPEHRATGEYCAEPHWTAADLPAGASYETMWSVLRPDRYEFLNIGAYRRHKTFEVRALEGTLDATTICNWITCHCRFIDGVRDFSFAEIDRLDWWPFLVRTFRPRLSSWLQERRQSFYPALDPVPVLW